MNKRLVRRRVVSTHSRVLTEFIVKVEMAQVISLQGKYPLALALTTLPRSQGWCWFGIRSSESRPLLLDSYHPRHRWDRQERAYLDTFGEQRASPSLVVDPIFFSVDMHSLFALSRFRVMKTGYEPWHSVRRPLPTINSSLLPALRMGRLDCGTSLLWRVRK